MDWQIRIITWHAGQLYAIDQDYVTAQARFENCYDPAEPADAQVLWNDYVHATLAFLNQDLKKLTLHRNRIAQGPDLNGAKANLHVVDGLIKCFGKSYLEAYSGCRS